MANAQDTADTRSMLERMRAGELYIAADPEIAAMSKRALNLATAYNTTTVGQDEERRRMLDELLGQVGEEVVIRPPFQVDYGVHITVGDRVFANHGLIALDVAAIVIGDDVQIGPNVQLLTPTHPLDPQQRLDKWEAGEPITIGENVWLGGGVIVLPGVTIGANSVVGAGSVVTRDLPPNVLAVGNPARVIRRLDDR
jgi:maltose O-acetyltransferase